jgi:hypothetical protein
MHTKLRRFNGSRTAHHSLSSKGRRLLVKNIKERNYDSLKNSHLQQQQSALSLSLIGAPITAVMASVSPAPPSLHPKIPLSSTVKPEIQPPTTAAPSPRPPQPPPPSSEPDVVHIPSYSRKSSKTLIHHPYMIALYLNQLFFVFL